MPRRKRYRNPRRPRGRQPIEGSPPTLTNQHYTYSPDHNRSRSPEARLQSLSPRHSPPNRSRSRSPCGSRSPSPYERYYSRSRSPSPYSRRQSNKKRKRRSRSRYDKDHVRGHEHHNNHQAGREPSPVDSEDERIRENNHHLRQNPNKIEIFAQVERVLKEDATQRKYYERKSEARTTNHWGQRKLLLSEIEFLTEYGNRSKKVVYAGAAPGAKNEYLASLFPEHTFVFVDPNPFHENLITASLHNPRIILINGFFTNESAQQYRDDHVLFISDIRTADNKVMNEETVENAIVEDNRMQLSWHLEMNPEASMLKFRLPWGKGTTRYLSGYSQEGKIYLPVWGRQSTTETRLVAVGNETYEYDNTKYEEQCFYFNTVTRCQYYHHNVDVDRVAGLCHCYDCASEVHILSQWARKFPSVWFSSTDAPEEEPTEDDITEQVTRMCCRLNIECSASGNRDLTITIGHGQQWFTPKIFDPQAGVVTDIVDGKHLNASILGSNYTRKERGRELNDDLFQSLPQTPPPRIAMSP